MGEQPGRDARLSVARQYLRMQQADWAGGVAQLPGPPPAEVASQRANQRAASAVTEGDAIFLDGFRFPAASERQRFARTQAIIDRVAPGPHEDGVYLEVLARQVASIENFLEPRSWDARIPMLLGDVLIGTTGQPLSHAATTRVRETPIIELSAGLMYAYYQVAKAVVLSWLQQPSPERSLISFSSRIGDTRAVLDADPTPVAIVVETLVNWFRTGIARPSASKAPPPQYQLPLTMLITFAERFVVAHEYAHALDHAGIPHPGQSANAPPAPSDPANEIRADIFAAQVVTGSGLEIDDMAPNMTLQGALLGMKVHEIADEALVMARGGAPLPPSTTHPPFDVRRRIVTEAYAAHYEQFGPDFDVEGLLVASDTVDELWRRAKPAVQDALTAGGPFHPIWSGRL